MKSKFLIKGVPYYSQYLDTFVIDSKNREHKNIIDGYWFKRSCGVASLKMVMDYLGKAIPRYKRQPIISLIRDGLELGAYSHVAGGWYHDGLIEISKKYGFKGKRFDWSNKSNKELDRAGKEKGLEEIKKILESAKPLIASVHRNFTPKNSGHLIVLIGFEFYKKKLTGFYCNDPESYDKNSKNYAFVDIKKFLNGWKGRAITIDYGKK